MLIYYWIFITIKHYYLPSICTYKMKGVQVYHLEWLKHVNLCLSNFINLKKMCLGPSICLIYCEKANFLSFPDLFLDNDYDYKCVEEDSVVVIKDSVIKSS